MVWDPKNWIDDLVNYRTPSCIVLGLKIYDDETCNDLYKAFNGIYFATFIVFGMIMIFQGVKALATAVKLICFTLTKKSAEKRLFDTKMCHLFLNDLNIISDRYHRIWNRETKNEILRKFSEHRHKCKICEDSYCVRNTLQNFFTQSNRKDLADKPKQSDMKLVFLNNRYSGSNGELKHKKEKANTKVNNWFSRQVGRSWKKHSKSKSKSNIHPNAEESNESDCSGDRDCEIEESKKPQKKKDSLFEKDPLRKEISLNIDEIQFTLSKYDFNDNYKDRENSNKKFKRLNKHNGLNNLRKIYYKNVINLKPNIKYPVLLLQDRSQPKLILKYKYKFNSKTRDLSKIHNINDGKSFMRCVRSKRRIPLHKRLIIEKLNENKKTIEENKNAIEIRNKINDSKKISELNNKSSNDGGISMSSSTRKEKFHKFPSRIPTFLYPNESNSSTKFRKNDTQKNITRRFSVQDRINDMQQFNKKIPVRNETRSSNHLTNSNCIYPSKRIHNTSSRMDTSLNLSVSCDKNETPTQICNFHSNLNDSDNSIKDEILTNIVNLPSTTNFFKQKYKFYKNSKIRRLGSYESNRLDVILEHTPWDV